IREMPIKTEMPLYTIRMAKMQNTDMKCRQRCGATGTLICCSWGCKMIQPLWKTSLAVSYKTKHIHTCDPPAIALLSIYSKELKTYVHTKTCTWMFITALFIIAKTWKQPRCPSVGGWI
ncbi:LORF2 protein, partial [Crocuta crocuta]